VRWETLEQLVDFTDSGRFGQCGAPVEPFLAGAVRAEHFVERQGLALQGPGVITDLAGAERRSVCRLTPTRPLVTGEAQECGRREWPSLQDDMRAPDDHQLSNQPLPLASTWVHRYR
jgi:hypothetical protein